MNIEEILKNVPDKRQNKGTTSIQFKKSFYEFFINQPDARIAPAVELGTHYGYSTRLMSFLFDRVITFDNVLERTEMAKDFNKDRDNISFYTEDIYELPWWEKVHSSSVCFIDAMHDYDSVTADIENSLKIIAPGGYLVFDDFGLFPEVKSAVLESIQRGELALVKYLGEPAGSTCRTGKVLQDWEGIVCQRTAPA
jgi:hypothetical protein